MKISELIERLEKFKEENGDLECQSCKDMHENEELGIQDVGLQKIQLFKKAIVLIYFK